MPLAEGLRGIYLSWLPRLTLLLEHELMPVVW